MNTLVRQLCMDRRLQCHHQVAAPTALSFGSITRHSVPFYGSSHTYNEPVRSFQLQGGTRALGSSRQPRILPNRTAGTCRHLRSNWFRWCFFTSWLTSRENSSAVSKREATGSNSYCSVILLNHRSGSGRCVYLGGDMNRDL
jgi:hypothetical protein